MAFRRARRSVPQAVAHGAQPADRPVQLFRLGREQRPVDARPPVGREHERLIAGASAMGAVYAIGGMTMTFAVAGILIIVALGIAAQSYRRALRSLSGVWSG